MIKTEYSIETQNSKYLLEVVQNDAQKTTACLVKVSNVNERIIGEKLEGISGKMIKGKLEIKSPYEFKLVFKYNPMILKPNNELGKRLKYSLKKEGLPIKYGVQKYITEATILRNADIPSIVFGPGDDNLFHKNDEKIAINDLVKVKKVYTNLFLNKP